MREFEDDIFAETAQYYAQFRPAYPARMFNDIVQYFDLNDHGRLFDLGCGTGELCLPLARYFEQVLAIDPDQDMLKIGRAKARELKISNISWQKGSSKDLTGVEGIFKLIVMGRSFHWMDQETVLDRLYNFLGSGGGIVVVGNASSPKDTQTAQKDQIIKNLVSKYIGPQRRAGKSFYVEPDKNYQDLFNESKFGFYENRIYNTKVVRTVQQELGNLYSMSWARRSYFGDKIEQFEREFKIELSKIMPAQGFTETIKFEAFFLRK